MIFTCHRTLANYGQFVVSRGMIITTVILALHLYVPLFDGSCILAGNLERSKFGYLCIEARNMTVFSPRPMQNLFQVEELFTVMINLFWTCQ